MNMRPVRHEQTLGDLLSKTDDAEISSPALSPEPATEEIVKLVTQWKKWVMVMDGTSRYNLARFYARAMQLTALLLSSSDDCDSVIL